MHLKHLAPAVLLGLLSSAPNAAASPAPKPGNQSPDPYKVYTIRAENITAKLIGRGARLTSLIVNDRNGNPQDVVVGFDDPTKYKNDTNYFGPVVGRYANRIKNGTFTIDGTTYHIPKNDHDGIDTLHGGEVGYDKRDWDVTAHSESSITFSFLDHALQGFPGDVLSHATYTVDTKVTPENPKGLPQLTTQLVSLALTEATPIMLANHIYWNLNGFKKPNVLSDTTLQLPLSNRFVATDGILIPNGTISSVDVLDGVGDFTSPKLIGADIAKAVGFCGTVCQGYDNCWIVDRPPQYAAPNSMVPVVHMKSSTTGISLDVATNQPAVQIYSCNGQAGTMPVKPSQIERNRAEGIQGATTVNKWGCVVIETENWIDGINHPEWGQLATQIYTPGGPPAINAATYQFGTF